MRNLLVICGLGVAISACGGGAGGGGDDTAAIDASAAAPDAPAGEDLDMQAADFGCIRDGTKVDKFFIKNPLGHLDDAVAVATSATGGRYPVGTILQLVPQEAMVKRATGWNPTTNDWEFFALSVSGATTTIQARGVEDVSNSFGGNCFACHDQAAPQWDLVCETTHGCDPLQISDTIIENLQNGDSRCN
ncbi:MAG: hypothetical protein H6709_13725 [Kofleriaceae bacterium]|nr:hypothetical protein [Kofleriaceae bacterium]MCB9573138.1 hypothetical protein [Kofleriaceae bacterium]